jgi:hypothetical protein
MRRRTAERGEGKLGCIFWFVVLAIGAMIAWKAVPVKMHSAELYDYMDELARFSAAKDTPEQLQKKILTKAFELDLPLDKDHVHVEKMGERVKMTASYTVPLEFPGYTYHWNFDFQLDRQLFLI